MRGSVMQRWSHARDARRSCADEEDVLELGEGGLTLGRRAAAGLPPAQEDIDCVDEVPRAQWLAERADAGLG